MEHRKHNSQEEAIQRGVALFEGHCSKSLLFCFALPLTQARGHGVSMMDGLARQADEYGRSLIDEPSVRRLSSLLRERGQPRAILRATRTAELGR